MITSVQVLEPADVAGHYDDLDPYYREMWGEHLHHGLWRTGKESPGEAVVQLINHLAEQMHLSESDRVCDVGCGYGGTARYLARKHRVHVTGVTLSHAQQDYAAQQNGDLDVQVLVQDWGTNPFDDASFDALISIECLSHVKDKQQYFDQVARVLKPGRRAVIAAWLANEQATRWQQHYLLEPICREGRLAGMATRGEVLSMIEAAGLRPLGDQDLSRQVRRTWRICARRVWWNVSTRPSYWRVLLRRTNAHAVFLVCVYRILAAYYLGAMRYGVFVMEKP